MKYLIQISNFRIEAENEDDAIMVLRELATKNWPRFSSYCQVFKAGLPAGTEWALLCIGKDNKYVKQDTEPIGVYDPSLAWGYQVWQKDGGINPMRPIPDWIQKYKWGEARGRGDTTTEG